jgi:hypothetical protein
MTKFYLNISINTVFHNRIQIYWLHILLYKSKVVYDVYKLLYNDVNNGKTNWVSNVRNLLFSLGLNYVWISSWGIVITTKFNIQF